MDEIDEALVGHVILRRRGRVVAVPVVELGWVEEIGDGIVDDAIQPEPTGDLPAFRVWRSEEAEAD